MQQQQRAGRLAGGRRQRRAPRRPARPHAAAAWAGPRRLWTGPGRCRARLPRRRARMCAQRTHKRARARGQLHATRRPYAGRQRWPAARAASCTRRCAGRAGQARKGGKSGSCCCARGRLLTGGAALHGSQVAGAPCCDRRASLAGLSAGTRSAPRCQPRRSALVETEPPHRLPHTAGRVCAAGRATTHAAQRAAHAAGHALGAVAGPVLTSAQHREHAPHGGGHGGRRRLAHARERGQHMAQVARAERGRTRGQLAAGVPRERRRAHAERRTRPHQVAQVLRAAAGCPLLRMRCQRRTWRCASLQLFVPK